MTKPEDISWGRYKSWTGPFFRGTKRFELPPNPSDAHKMVAVTTSSEGGSPDAINGYDRCIVSTSYLQNCEAYFAYFLTSQLLGKIAEHNPTLLDPLSDALNESKAVFTQTSRGRWRFIFHDNRGEVDTVAEQRNLFCLNSDGHTWDDASKAHGKLWAAGLANTLVQAETDPVQVEFAARRIRAYALPSASKVLFDDEPSEGWVGALRAGYLSYAVNIPTMAAKCLETALLDAPEGKWSADWCIHIFKVLTFASKVAIWPHRYDAIRPIIEKLYGVDMPDFADELADWQEQMDEGLERDGFDPSFYQLDEVQQVLIDMGYDLGPWGADGKMGAKTKDAIMTFQGLNGLDPDGVVGPKTRAKLVEAWRAGVCT
jgi:hypothetical protein